MWLLELNMSALVKSYRTKTTSDDARKYKERADEVLLSRGRNGRTQINARGKTQSQIFDMLMGLQ